VLHLLPLPLFVVGECLQKITGMAFLDGQRWKGSYVWLPVAALAASPLLDMILGAYIVFPVYEAVSSYAVRLAQ